ncbi:SPOR domain-containing protein [Sphingopyxis granuli]|uniref:SPOR domain-containing protein n=1 Tax=Sphingopyxis granuli TaxID=267128 RepID=UPI001F52DF8A|nr:SPOR domain-containing protein [Sphingopyxis granuli]UNK79115.1 SPOR domain-containing protein [Sphingopyxis granuli]
MRSYRTLLLAAPLIPAVLLAAPALAAPKAAAAAPDVKAGVDAWEAGDYAKAVAVWRPLAIAGDPDAQFNLGQAYKLGRGVPADLGQAEGWYRRAAKQGHLQAEDNLGLVLFTANRRDEAMPFIARSAERGEPRAQYVLGTAMFNGDLATKDWPRAYALTKRASDAGLGIASARLAQLDRLIPLDQRQRGLALLPEMEKNEQRARLAAVNAAAPEAPKSAPSPVQTASLPASVPGTLYTPPPVLAPAPVPAPTPRPAAPLSPAAQHAAAAAAEAAASADVAAAAAKDETIRVVTPPPSQPAAPGTSYAAPPEKGPLPPAETPATPPTPAPAPAPVQEKVVAATPKAGTPAPAPAAGKSPWRAQLGAFGVEANARSLWRSVEKAYPAAAARQPYLVKSGKLTRLQVGDFASKADAESFCSAVKKDGRPCLVVDR